MGFWTGKKAIEPLSSKEYANLQAQINELVAKMANLKAEFTGIELELAYLKNKSTKMAKREPEPDAFNGLRAI